MLSREKDDTIGRARDGQVYYALGYRDALCMFFATVRSVGVSEALLAYAGFAQVACGSEPNPHVEWYLETHKADAKTI
jgi:predicted component of viral defense system (DUF524 family)